MTVKFKKTAAFLLALGLLAPIGADVYSDSEAAEEPSESATEEISEGDDEEKSDSDEEGSIAGDDGSAFASRPPEHGMLREMGDAARKTGLVPGAAADAQGTPGHRGGAPADCIAQPGRCGAAPHYRFLDIRRRSSARKPAALRPEILCLRT